MASDPEISITEEISEKPASSAIKELTQKIEKLDSGEEKIRLCLEFMQAALSDKTPRFKDYWDVKKLCLPLFKEALSPHARGVLWDTYIEVSTEARLLKDILDEQSAFAVEQIDLAIKAIEDDLDHTAEVIQRSFSWTLPDECHALQKQREVYEPFQNELNLLNTLAARINSLRKEVIRTEMRIRFKNKFFDRLSKAGDRVFPRRKELIQIISTQFLEDVQEFANREFSVEKLKGESTFSLREEIKTLQNLAKEMTLDTRTFSETRLLLSQCWDVLKEVDKERKKEVAEKKEIFKKNVDLVLDKIKLLAERCKAETFTYDDAMKQSKEIANFMKNLDLGRDEVNYLKDEIAQARAPVVERDRKQQEAREKEIEESERQRRDKIEEFKKRLQEVIDRLEEKTIEELLAAKDDLQKQLSGLLITHAEKELLEHALKGLRDNIIDKKEKNIASLTSEQQNSLQHLTHMLEEWKSQKTEIENQIKNYGKALAGSGFDFEKAMRYRELMDAEKKRLEKVNAALEEIEAKIEDLESGTP